MLTTAYYLQAVHIKTHRHISTIRAEILYLPQLLFHLPNLNQVLLELIEGQGMESGVDSSKKVDTVSHIGSIVFNYFLREIRR